MLHKIINRSHKNIVCPDGTRIKAYSSIFLDDSKISSQLRRLGTMGIVAITPAHASRANFNIKSVETINNQQEQRKTTMAKLRSKNLAQNTSSKSSSTPYRTRTKNTPTKSK